MTVNTHVKASKDVISTELDGEVVLMHVTDGVYYGLNRVGGAVWELIKQPIAVGAVCDSVAQEFEVARDVCERDVCSLLEQLEDAGLVEVVRP